jgi:putative ABC transport system permease protein
MRLSELAHRFPSVTIIDVAAVLDQVRLLISRVNVAVGYVFLFTLAAGALVLVAALQATQDERARESALLRSLGASRAFVRRGLMSEFMLIGGIAGVLACAIASVAAWVLARQVFNIDYRFNAMLWPIGIASGLAGVIVFGIVGLRRALSEPPVSVLRRP